MNKGKILTTVPLTHMDQVAIIKERLEGDVRGMAIFTFFTNTLLRINDGLDIKREDVRGNEVVIRERKTGKLKTVYLNEDVVKALDAYLASRTDSFEWLFVGQRGRLTHGYVGALVKKWFAWVGVDERVATHSLRKTGARLRYTQFDVSLSTLMHIMNHSSERTTLTYIGITSQDVKSALQVSL